MSDDPLLDEALDILLEMEEDLPEAERQRIERLKSLPEGRQRAAELEALLSLAGAILAAREDRQEVPPSVLDRIQGKIRPIYEQRVRRSRRIQDALDEFLAASESPEIAARIAEAKKLETLPAEAMLDYHVGPAAADKPATARLPQGGKVETWRNSQGSVVVACTLPQPGPPPLVLLIPWSAEQASMACLPQRSGSIAASGEDVAKFDDVDEGEYLVVVIPGAGTTPE